eukprot:5752573-Ditylum_brightwellii.AAC.1
MIDQLTVDIQSEKWASSENSQIFYSAQDMFFECNDCSSLDESDSHQGSTASDVLQDMLVGKSKDFEATDLFNSTA